MRATWFVQMTLNIWHRDTKVSNESEILRPSFEITFKRANPQRVPGEKLPAEHGVEHPKHRVYFGISYKIENSLLIPAAFYKASVS